MKNFLLTIFLAVLIGLVIISLTYAAPTCVEVSQKTYERGVRWGYKMRQVTGYTEDWKYHRWAEYFYKGQWRVWDNSIWYIGKSYYNSVELGYVTVKILEE